MNQRSKQSNITFNFNVTNNIIRLAVRHLCAATHGRPLRYVSVNPRKRSSFFFLQLRLVVGVNRIELSSCVTIVLA